MSVITLNNYDQFIDELYSKPGERIKIEVEKFLLEFLNRNTVSTRYFTRENFQDFLTYLKEQKPFARYDETELNAGLKLEEMNVVDNNIINLTMEQGKYYYSSTPIRGINFVEYKQVDKKVMGEIVVQFRTASNLSMDDIKENFKYPAGINWFWVTSNGALTPTWKPNSNYQIKITTDQTGTFFAYVNKYETLNITDITSPDIDNTWIEIEYIVTSSDNSFIPFKNEFRKKNKEIISSYLYAPMGEKNGETEYSEYTFTSDNNNLLTATSQNPKMLIKFIDKNNEDIIEPDIDLSFMLEDVNIKSIKMKINAKRIKTMEYMLANGRTDSLRASSIDLTGIYNSNEFIADSPSSSMFKGLFNGRKMSDSGNNLKLFGKDSNGNPTGINTSKALNLSQMFNGGILTNNNIHVIEGLDVSLCNNFSYMFSNSTNISKIDLSSWLTNLNWEERSLKFKDENLVMNFTGMFQNTNIDDSQLKNISNFLYGVTDFNNENLLNKKSVDTYNLSYMFFLCKNIKNAEYFDLIELFKRDENLKSINMSHMFEECVGLIDGPIFEISRINNSELESIDLSYMFAKCSINADKTNYKNFSKWYFDYPGHESGTADEVIKCPTINLNSMFKEAALYKIQYPDNTNNIFNFCKPGSKLINYIPDTIGKYHTTILLNTNTDLNYMFSNCIDNNSYKGISVINFNLDFGLKENYFASSLDSLKKWPNSNKLHNILDTTINPLSSFNIYNQNCKSNDSALFYILDFIYDGSGSNDKITQYCK